MDYNKLSKVADSQEWESSYYREKFAGSAALDLRDKLAKSEFPNRVNRDYYPVSENEVKVEFRKYSSSGRPMGSMSSDEWEKTVSNFKKAVSKLGVDASFDDRGEEGLFIKVKDSSKVNEFSAVDSERKGPKLTYPNLARRLSKEFAPIKWNAYYDDYYEQYTGVFAEVDEEIYEDLSKKAIDFVKKSYPDYVFDDIDWDVFYSDGELSLEFPLQLVKHRYEH